MQHYRAGVGAVIVRGDQVLVFQPRGLPGTWQFPQGGLLDGETAEQALWRELREETGLGSGQLRLLCRHPEVLSYAFPVEIRRDACLGQSQVWFYLELTGEEAAISTDQHELLGWKWVSMREAHSGVHPVKRGVYRELRRYLSAAQAHLEQLGGAVTLRAIDSSDAVNAMLRLAVTPDQDRFVAPNGSSIAQALHEPKSWLRAIYAGETAVGLILLYDSPEEGASAEPPELDALGLPKPEYFLWRLLVDTRHQHRGYGRAAVELLVGHVRTRPRATELLVSFVPGEGSPEDFYLSLGFRPTGRVEEGEVILSLPI